MTISSDFAHFCDFAILLFLLYLTFKLLKIQKFQGLYSQHLIFFITQELAQKVRAFDTGKPVELCYRTV